MVNYRNSKVYKIWSTQGENIYIGSTTKQYLCQRMDKHRSNYKAFQNGKYHYISSFKLFEDYGLENCFVELLEAKECNSKDELSQLEGQYIRSLSCVNKRIESRTKKEYIEDNKEHFVEYKKKYYIDNKEENTKKHDCVCGLTYSNHHRARHERSIKHKLFLEKPITQ
jgi:hypothetical protein